MNYYLNQARSTVTQELIGWVTLGPDWSGLDFPGPGSPEYIAATELVGRSILVGVTFERDIADEVECPDAAAAGNQVEGEGSDTTLTVTDDVSWLLDVGSAASATIAITDSLTRVADTLRKRSSTINLFDTLSYVRDSSNTGLFNRFIADSIVLFDQSVAEPYARTFQDYVAVVDDTHRQLYESDGTISLSHDDTIAITDNVIAALL